jgi:hypothetical protein
MNNDRFDFRRRVNSGEHINASYIVCFPILATRDDLKAYVAVAEPLVRVNEDYCKNECMDSASFDFGEEGG